MSEVIQSVKQFYFLDYFYVLLRSVELTSNTSDVFQKFKSLKQEYQLGESKYKKLTIDVEKPTKRQNVRYLYTYKRVIDEALEYKLISAEQDGDKLMLTDLGVQFLNVYRDSGADIFYRKIFELMEEKYRAFEYLINFLYVANKYRPGLLVLPSYSPSRLGKEKKNIRTSEDVVDYIKALTKRISEDLKTYVNKSIDLTPKVRDLQEKLIEDGLIPFENKNRIDSQKYNLIVGRIRDYWLNYCLKDVYGYDYSLNSFDIWTYRGKQIGIINVTEFYPDPKFNGKIIYPTSVILGKANSRDFDPLFTYNNQGKSLYVHIPKLTEANQNTFVDQLVNAYYTLRKYYRTYFINLATVRELVCYGMKISERVFEIFLNRVYAISLQGGLKKIKISLEVDKLPEETKAMYLKKVPVTVDGKLRNIIAIDLKGDQYES